MERKKPKGEGEISTEEAFCALGRFVSWLEGRISPPSEFFESIARSRVECLKRIRALIDKRIENLEKRRPRKADKKATHVKVE